MKRKLLFLAALAASALGFNANAQTGQYDKPVPVFSPLADDGNTIQYLYNVEAGGFMLGANDWDTRASVSLDKGYQFKVAKNEDGATWTLNDYVEKGDSKIVNTWQAVFADGAGEIWVDNPNKPGAHDWVITELGDNKYKIANNNVPGGYLSVSPLLNDSRIYVIDSDVHASTWAFVNADDYTAYLAEYKKWVEEVVPTLKAATVPGTDITPAVFNKIESDEALKKVWSITNNTTFHINTWSWEGMTDGSWMTPTFIENWQGKEAGVLPEATISSTITGLVPNQDYKVSALIRAYNEGSTTPPTGAYLFAGEGKSDDISTGTNAIDGGKALVYGTFSATGTADAQGNLTIGIVEKDNNFNWIAMRDFQIMVAPIVIDGVEYTLAGDNLIENGSFEEGYTGWTNANNFSTEIGTGFTLKTEGAQEGSNYLFGSENGGSTATTSLGTAWEIEAGKAYLFSYYIKSETGATGTGYIKSALTNTPGQETKELGTPEVTGDGKWCKFEAAFKNTEYTYLQVQFRWLDSQWGFDNFTLYELTPLNPATEEDYQALNDAIETAEGNTLGFEAGQYAPYTNVDAIKALAAAKAINQEVANDKTVVTNTAEALTAAEWTANTEPMNAVYNGDFALSKPNTTSGADLDVPGWTSTNEAIRLLIGNSETYPGLASIESGKALFVHGSKITKYGEVEGYTMPLEPNSVYELTFKYTGWEGGNQNFKVAVKDAQGGDVLPENVCGIADKGPQEADCWYTYTTTFTTTEGGNVILQMLPGGNATFTDLSILRTPITAEVSEVGYATYVTPVAVEFGEDVEAFIVTSVVEGEATVAQLTAVEGAVPANTPVIIKAEEGVYDLAAVTEADEVEGNILEIAEGTETGEGIYVLAAINEVGFYALADGVTLPAGTVYLPYSKSEIKFIGFGNGDATGIQGVEDAAEAENGAIYNLAGQRVQNPTKGIYIVNGKKVLVK